MVTERPGAGPFILAILFLGATTVGLFVYAKTLRDERANATADVVASVSVSTKPVATQPPPTPTTAPPPTVATVTPTTPATEVDPTEVVPSTKVAVAPSQAPVAGGNGAAFRQSVTTVIAKAKPRFNQCYEAGLAKNDALAGTVKIRFTVDGTGKVVKAEDGGSTLPDANVITCIRTAFLKLQFSPPDGDTTTVTYPMVFAPPD